MTIGNLNIFFIFYFFFSLVPYLYHQLYATEIQKKEEKVNLFILKFFYDINVVELIIANICTDSLYFFRTLNKVSFLINTF